MRKLSILTLLLLFAFSTFSQVRKAPPHGAPKKTAAPQKKRPSSAASQKKSQTKKSSAVKSKRPSSKKSSAVPGKRASSKKPSSTKTSKKSSKSKSRKSSTPSWRAGQQAPTPQRYAEIQQALIDRGYLAGQATGDWGLESVEALKKFQQEQNLEPSGKLDSLSLIALGLGPSRDSTIPSPPPAGGVKTEPKPPQ